GGGRGGWGEGGSWGGGGRGGAGGGGGAACRTERQAARLCQDSPPNEPDSPALTLPRSYLSIAWRTTEWSSLPSRASSCSVLTTMECASIFRWRRAAGRVSEKPHPSAPSTP